TIVAIFVAYAVVRLLTVVEITPGGVGEVEVAYAAALSFVAVDGNDDAIVAGVLLFRLVTYVLPIAVGAGCYVFWQRKRSWRRAPPPEPIEAVAVVAAVADTRPPA